LEHLVSHVTKNGQPFLVRPFGLRRIAKALVGAPALPQPDGTLLRSIVTDRDDQIEILAAELLRVL
jgi:hypothetical protein